MALTFADLQKMLQVKETERKRFEDWVRSDAHQVYPLHLDQDDWGRYTDLTARAMWEAWKAGQEK